MANFYVDTASSGGNGTTTALTGANAAFATVAAVNAASFSAGDFILFKQGCAWSAGTTLTPPTAGSAGTPVTFWKYGTTGADPILDGAKTVASAWSLSGTNTWQTSLGVETFDVWFDGTHGRHVADENSCVQAGDYFGKNTGTLYVYSVGSPTQTITAAYYARAIYINAKDYITIDGLNWKRWRGYDTDYRAGCDVYDSDYCIIQNNASDHAGQYSVRFVQSNNFQVLDNNFTASWKAYNSIRLGTTSAGSGCTTGTIHGNTLIGGPATDVSVPSTRQTTGIAASYSDAVTIDSNTISAFTEYGLDPKATTTNFIIHDNVVHDIGGCASSSLGMDIFGSGHLVYKNTVYNVTRSGSAIDGGGILLDSYATGCSVYQNLVYSVAAAGIYAWQADNSSIYYNIMYDCANDPQQDGLNCAMNIGRSSHMTIYNNVIDATGAKRGITFIGTSGETCHSNTLKNNIIYCPTEHGIKLSDAYCSTDFISDYNDVYFTTGKFGLVVSTGYDTLADWRTGTSQDAHSVSADPLFVSTVTPDYHLQSSSPCINAGVSVGLTADFNGNPIH